MSVLDGADCEVLPLWTTPVPRGLGWEPPVGFLLGLGGLPPGAFEQCCHILGSTKKAGHRACLEYGPDGEEAYFALFLGEVQDERPGYGLLSPFIVFPVCEEASLMFERIREQGNRWALGVIRQGSLCVLYLEGEDVKDIQGWSLEAKEGRLGLMKPMDLPTLTVH